MTTPSLVSRTSSFRSLLLGALLVAAAASAATGGTVTLAGHVNTILNVAATPTGDATTLPMDGLGGEVVEHIVKVADVTMSTNNSSGLTLTATSGNLVNGGASIPFKVLTVDDAASSPLTTDFLAGTATYVSSVTGSDPRNLFIAYTPTLFLDPGDYAGSITLTVTDNG